MKQVYNTPNLAVYGQIEEITLSGVLDNSDVQGGPNGTADCPGGSTDPRCISG
ncbi:hypothetical protein [Merismopedia glauca]|jgi:hypothetical protein|uniref:hypothetical protein n=1 Tax=Merismopedia glauca TaxID=292586 RepID=UPI0015E791D0|nr:hypothetical protein [Merismopedia glauca]